MAIKTTSSHRKRTEVAILADATLVGVETAYNTHEATKAADATKTWECRVVNAYHDGTNYVIVAECNYPEYSDDPSNETVPLAP